MSGAAPQMVAVIDYGSGNLTSGALVEIGIRQAGVKFCLFLLDGGDPFRQRLQLAFILE